MAQTMQNLESSSRSNGSFNDALAAMQAAQEAYTAAMRQVAQQLVPIGSVLISRTSNLPENSLLLVQDVNARADGSLDVDGLLITSPDQARALQFLRTSGIHITLDGLQNGIVRVLSTSDDWEEYGKEVSGAQFAMRRLFTDVVAAIQGLVK